MCSVGEGNGRNESRKGPEVEALTSCVKEFGLYSIGNKKPWTFSEQSSKQLHLRKQRVGWARMEERLNVGGSIKDKCRRKKLEDWIWGIKEHGVVQEPSKTKEE